jgi:rubredoxin
MNRKINYPLPRPTWVCPHCGLVHQAADIVRIDDTQLRCKQCGQAFTPPSAEAKSRSIRFGDSPDLASGRFANGHY